MPMASWFIPPIVVPIGLVAMILAFAIYHACASAPPRQQAVAIGSPAGTLPPGGWHGGGRA